MASGTTFIVQGFYVQGRRLIADQARKMNTAEAAIDGAKRLAEGKAGVVDYSVVYEPEADVTSDPQVLFRAGPLPPQRMKARDAISISKLDSALGIRTALDS